MHNAVESVMSLPASDPAKQALLETILEAAADKLGDITPATLALYYSRYPQARQLFVEHGCGYTRRLELEMVDSALYCLMIWFERPLEVEIIYADAVPHHELLNIPAAFFAGLQAALVDVIAGTVAETDSNARAFLAQLKNQLTALIESYSTRASGPL
ncbi:MAG: hypothetical protein VR73_07550 [Gammaproteobacteria bacterium BRH_c0]|nr:MAG: hypothetical protein VR73_07550 [Gammaproteobacteria bacterium BRH_c0]